jgi:hypothetical protein
MKVHSTNIEIQGSGAVMHLNEAISGHARVMLLSSGLLQSFWVLVILYAVWLHNQAPTKQTRPQSVRGHDRQKG